MSHLQLLRRPIIPEENNAEQSTRHGLHASWTAKLEIPQMIYCKRKNDRLPRICIAANVEVVYSNLRISTKYPPTRFEFPLVTICYIEVEYAHLTVKSRTFDLRLKHVDNIDEVRDRLRFLVLRQRVPHSILRLPFEWEILPAEKPKPFFRHLRKYFNSNVLKNTFLSIICVNNRDFAH